MVIVFGVAPGLVMKNISPSVAALLDHYKIEKAQALDYAAKVESEEGTKQ